MVDQAKGKNINVQGLMEEAQEALRIKEEIREKVAGLRELLRHAVKAGEATDEQAEWINSVFAPRGAGASS